MGIKDKRYVVPIIISLFIIGIAWMSAVARQQYWLLSLVFVALALLPFFTRYERKKVNTREVMLMVMLIAIAAVSRVPFAAIPSVMPLTFIVIVSGYVFGAERGFMIGALAAIVSNLFLGQGPWTPWQMFSWGMIGYVTGLCQHTWWMRSKWGMAVYGFIAGLLFGWVMNISTIVVLIAHITWSSVVALYATSLLFELLHACTNVFFILVFAPSWIRILERFKQKYGLS